MAASEIQDCVCTPEKVDVYGTKRVLKKMLTSSSELHIACLQQVKAQTDYYNSYYLQTQNMVLQSP